MQQSDLDARRTLLTLIDGGSLQAAGRVPGRGPTVLSRRLQALEARLGVRLVARSTRRVAPTEAGAA